MRLVKIFSHICDIVMIMKQFAERLRELRLEKNLSQMQLSKATGLSHTAIVYWETQQRIPNANAVVILAKFFDVSADYLLGLKN